MTIENQRNFEYFYGIESEEFNFYQVPKVLLQDPYYKELKDSTKLLYSVFLNRMSLSRKNNWVDEENKVYIIYSIKEICEDMGCCKETAIDRTKELEKYGLIEIIKKGQGKCNLIYVKDFLHVTNSASNADEYTEVGKSEFKKSGKQNSRSQESRIHKVGESDTINNNITHNSTHNSTYYSTIALTGYPL